MTESDEVEAVLTVDVVAVDDVAVELVVEVAVGVGVSPLGCSVFR